MDHYKIITELKNTNNFIVLTVKTDDGYDHKSGYVYGINPEYITLSDDGELSNAKYDDILYYKIT